MPTPRGPELLPDLSSEAAEQCQPSGWQEDNHNMVLRHCVTLAMDKLPGCRPFSIQASLHQLRTPLASLALQVLPSSKASISPIEILLNSAKWMHTQLGKLHELPVTPAHWGIERACYCSSLPPELSTATSGSQQVNQPTSSSGAAAGGGLLVATLALTQTLQLPKLKVLAHGGTTAVLGPLQCSEVLLGGTPAPCPLVYKVLSLQQAAGDRQAEVYTFNSISSLLGAAFHCPSLVQLFACVHACPPPADEDEEQQYSEERQGAGVLLMLEQYCEGGTLHQYMERLSQEVQAGTRVAADAQRLVWAAWLPVLAGLRHLHQRGMYHGDVKPMNVFMQPTPWAAALGQLEQLGLAWVAELLLPASCRGADLLLPRLGDYGSVGAISAPGPDTWSPAATPAFSHPQVRGRPPPQGELGARHDAWAWGAGVLAGLCQVAGRQVRRPSYDLEPRAAVPVVQADDGTLHLDASAITEARLSALEQHVLAWLLERPLEQVAWSGQVLEVLQERRAAMWGE
jgi:hypothetical protein